LALAASFGLLSVVPLVPFRQLAFAMFVGIMLVPAALTVFGRWSAWPRQRDTGQEPEPHHDRS